jgi:formate hydrogenlyase subunit 6/NADH:ubiquinone oxidoreductase subunit I
MEKELPILFNKKDECCGCTACFAICPKSAITMLEDEEGFEYPHINPEKCVRCYMCVKACPIKK